MGVGDFLESDAGFVWVEVAGVRVYSCYFSPGLIGEVEKDPWALAFKIVTKRLVARRKTPGLDNPDRVQYIVRSLFSHVEPFQRQD